MISLIYLYYRILINVYKDKFFSKNTLAGMIILTILSLFFISFGYFFGYLVVYLNYHAELKLENLFFSIRQSFCIFSGVIILSNSLSPLKFITQLNFNTLKPFPLSKSSIITFAIITGFIDIRYLLLAELLLSLIAGAGGFSISFISALILLSLSLTLLYFIHLVVELIQSVIKLFGSMPKLKVISLLILFSGIIYLIILNKLTWIIVVNNNLISWNINSIFSLSIFHQGKWIYQLLMLNIIYSFGLFGIVLVIKIFHANLDSKHVATKLSKTGIIRIKLSFLISFFPDKIKQYIEKDIRYIIRSNRSLLAIFIEIVILLFFCYMHLVHSKIYDHVYIALSFVLIVPVFFWDFFLSNYWGFEKKGFGFYLFSNSDLREAILSKNISFILVRFPLVIIVSVILSFLYSFKYLPVILLISYLLNIVSLMFSNFVSIKHPYPVDLKENAFSQTQPAKFSLIGFIGLLTYLILPVILLFIIYKLGIGFSFYSISILTLFIIIIVYIKLLSYSASLLKEHKEIIYKKLIKL